MWELLERPQRTVCETVHMGSNPILPTILHCRASAVVNGEFGDYYVDHHFVQFVVLGYNRFFFTCGFFVVSMLQKSAQSNDVR